MLDRELLKAPLLYFSKTIRKHLFPIDLSLDWRSSWTGLCFLYANITLPWPNITTSFFTKCTYLLALGKVQFLCFRWCKYRLIVQKEIYWIRSRMIILVWLNFRWLVLSLNSSREHFSFSLLIMLTFFVVARNWDS